MAVSRLVAACTTAAGTPPAARLPPRLVACSDGGFRGLEQLRPLGGRGGWGRNDGGVESMNRIVCRVHCLTVSLAKLVLCLR